MADERIDVNLKAFCPRCGVRVTEDGADTPEHATGCPSPRGFYPLVIFRPVATPDTSEAANG